MINAGTNVNTKDKLGRTPLHIAADKGLVSAVELLVASGSDLKARDLKGRLPIHYAALSRIGLGALVLLIEKGSDIDAQDDEQCTPLECIARDPGKDLLSDQMRLLLKKKAKLDNRDRNGNTPLMELMRRSRFENDSFPCEDDEKRVCWRDKIRMLIQAGADVTVVNSENENLLHLAAGAACDDKLVRLLVGAGVDVNGLDNKSMTPLHLAIRHLLEAGATADVRCSDGKTPLMYCTQICMVK